MPPLYKTIRNKVVSGCLYLPSLECCAQLQHIHYRFAGLRTPETRHNPSAFCIGNFKSGTMSVANLLGHQARDKHEPHAYLFSKMWLKKESGQLSQQEWTEFLIRRSNALSLDYESSGFLTTEAALLADLFPESKFILTIREPISWMRSILNHILKNRRELGYHYWEPVLQKYFGSASFPQEETPLKALNLYPIDGMLSYWRRSNQSVIDLIPAEQLLITSTSHLSESIVQIENFLGLPAESLDRKKSHHHKSAKNDDHLSQIPRDYLQNKICKLRLAAPDLSAFIMN